MKELVYILPDSDKGVASVVKSLVAHSSGDYKVKVILLQHNLSQKLRVKSIPSADEVIRVELNTRWQSRYNVVKEINSYLHFDSILICNDGGLDLDIVRDLSIDNTVVYIFHGDYKYYYQCLKEKSNYIDSVITVSDYIKEKIEVNFNHLVSSKKITSIKFPVKSIKNSFREFNATEPLNIFYAGSLVPDKGVLLFPEIVNELQNRNIDFKFTIVGNGSEFNFLKDTLKENASVNMLGFLDNSDVYQLLKSQDVFLLCSYKEGLPVSIVEAMLNGVVPISTDLESGIPELITQNVTGYRVAKDDVNGFVNSIEDVFLNREKLKGMASTCIDFAKSNFDPYVQTSKYEDYFIKTDLEKKKPRPKISILNRILNRLPYFVSLKIKSLLK